MSKHGYRYVGKGERFRGVPSRDLTQTQYDTLTPLDQRTVLESGAWEPITAKEAKEAEQEAKRQAEEAAKTGQATESGSQEGEK